MLKNPRNLLWLIPLIFFVTSPLWIPGVRTFLKPRGGFEPASVVPNPGQQKQQFIMDEITITMSSAGRVEWIINAERAYTIKSDKEIGMIEVDAVYTADEDDKAHITSGRGKYNVDTKHLTLIDNVVIVKPTAQQEMYTDLLHYYNTKKMVVCPGDVELRGPDFTVEAGRLDYDLARHRYDFSGRVKVELGEQNKI